MSIFHRSASASAARIYNAGDLVYARITMRYFNTRPRYYLMIQRLRARDARLRLYERYYCIYARSSY